MSLYQDLKQAAGLKDDEAIGLGVVLVFAVLFVPALLGAFGFLSDSSEVVPEVEGLVEEVDLEADAGFNALEADEPVAVEEPVATEAVVVQPTAVPTAEPIEPTAEPIAPAAPAVDPSTINYVSRTDTLITLSGVATANESLDILDNGALAGTIVADATGNWSIDVPFDASVKEHVYEAKGLADVANALKYIIAE